MSVTNTRFPFFGNKADPVELYYTLPKGWRVAIYGAGGAGSAFRQFIASFRPDLDVRCFVDSSREGEKDGLPVVLPGPDLHETTDVIIICSYMHHGIAANLRAHGLLHHVIYKEPGKNADIYFADYLAPLIEAMGNSAYSPASPRYIAARRAAYLRWTLARMHAQSIKGKTTIITSSCWIGDNERKTVLEALASNADNADIAERVANLTLIGFAPDDFPRNPEEYLLYDHWSEEAMRCVETLSQEFPVITTISHSMLVRGMDTARVTYLGPEQIATEVKREMLPRLQRFIDATSADSNGTRHLMIIGVSSSMLTETVRKILHEHYPPAALAGRNVFFRIFEGLPALEGGLAQTITSRSQLGRVQVVLTNSMVQALEQSGTLNTLHFNTICTESISTRDILLRAVQRAVADILRSQPA